MPDLWLIVASAALVGLVFGSFLNVCVFRWPQDQSVVSPPSHCPSCGEPVRWYDNVPILSYLVLRGRCRFCRVRISPQYPLVELATGLTWAGMFTYHGVTFEALRGSILLTILFGIALTDARYYLIPDEFSLGGLGIGLAMAALPGGVTLSQGALGAVVGFLMLWAVAKGGEVVFKKEAMGGGDIKMMAMVGSFLGPGGVLLTLFLGALLGSLLYGPVALKSKKLVPFGIFLAAGAAIAYGWGDTMIEWYRVNMLGLPPS